MRSSDITLSALLVALALGLGPGCDAGSGDDPAAEDKEPFTCDLGLSGTEAAPFVELSTSDRAELDLGFQGFLFISVRLRAAAPPAEVDVKYSATVAGVTDPIGGDQHKVVFEAAASGMVTGEILVFFPGGEVGTFAGKQAELAIRAESADRTCLATGTVLLVDDDPCIHTGEEPICPEGTR